MIVDLANLSRNPFEFGFTLNPEDIDLERDDVRVVSEIETSGAISTSAQRFEVEGTIKYEQSRDCSRCLDPVQSAVTVPFDVTYYPAGTEFSEDDHEVSLDELDAAVLEGEDLDLNELVREQILLALPEQAFCRDDCQGLCEKCGANRNLIDCKCNESEIDPRWAALKDLK